MVGRDKEISCFQFLPSTYKLYSIQVLGYVATSTPVNAEYIATVKMEELSKKYKPEQIFLKWNAGEGATKCSRGINKNGTPYDSCSYVQKAMNYYKQLAH
jgi:hypothetical protein